MGQGGGRETGTVGGKVRGGGDRGMGGDGCDTVSGGERLVALLETL